MTSPLLQLSPEDLATLAELVAERVLAELDGSLSRDRASGGRLLTAAEVAERWAVKRDWVYRHAERLGAVRLGDGDKAPLRFYAERVAAALDTCSGSRESPQSDPPPRQRSAGQRAAVSDTAIPLLPVRGL